MLMLALLAAAPELGPIKTFGDWTVACDNVHACEMTSLTPGDGALPDEDSGYYEVSLAIARAAGPGGGFTVEVSFNTPAKGETSVRIDDQVVTGGAARNDTLSFGGADAARIVAAIIKGKALTVTDIGGAVIGRVSLSGSSAALRFIDAEQGRAGTVTAAVAKGARPATAVPAAIAGPVIRFVRPSGKPAPITPALRAAMNKASDCGSAYEGAESGPPAIEAHPIGGGKTLALLPCGSGAYNYSTIAFIVTGGRAAFARFDSLPGGSAAEGMATLTNAGWDKATSRLSSYDKGRGLGDCGASETYVWDGTMFRLVEARQMPDCRGSVNWLPVWRAAPVAQ